MNEADPLVQRKNQKSLVGEILLEGVQQTLEKGRSKKVDGEWLLEMALLRLQQKKRKELKRFGQ